MLQLGRWRPRHTSAQPRQRPDKHRQPKQSRQQGLKPAAVWCKLGVSSGVGVSGVSSVSSVSECRAFLAPLTLLTRVDTVRASSVSRMSVDSVECVEAVSRWCRLTLVSSVSSVSRVCRECVESVEPGLKRLGAQSYRPSSPSFARKGGRMHGRTTSSTNGAARLLRACSRNFENLSRSTLGRGA